jgi:metallophosphoesterase superfamily enzyme
VLAAVLSDLHLGMRSGADLLRRAEVRARLFEGIADADELVLLGDSIELRDDRLAESLTVALPFFEALGEALGGRRVTIVPGNHDHRLVEEALRRTGALGLETRSSR